MKKIFVPVESVTIAHVVRPLQVAKALRRRGVEVIFGANERFRWAIEEEDFEVRPVFCADASVLLDAVRRLDFRRQIAFLPEYLASDITAIRDVKGVDAVLGDFRFTIRLAAEHCGVPHIAFTNGYYTPYYDVLPSIPEAVAASWPRWLRDSATLRQLLIKELIPRLQGRPYRKLCRRNQLRTRIRSGLDIALSETMTLIGDLPEFTPQSNLPPNFHFVGPILWEPKGRAEPLPAEFDGFRRPLVYVTLGTSGGIGTLQQVLKTLAECNCDVIVSTGSEELRWIDGNVFAASFVRASEVLERASLMICHGGNGSIYQGLSHGVPVLCISTFFDQEWNGQRVVELNLGAAVHRSRLGKAPLAPLVERLMGDAEVRSNVRRFRSLIAQWDGPELAASRILSLLEGAPGQQAGG